MRNRSTSNVGQSRVRPRKIVFLGDTGVGKTSIIRRATLQQHPGHPFQTIGSSFQLMSIAPNSDANPINVHVWDTAGQERYAALVPYYSRGADALVFVYDVTIDMSFDNLETWISVVEGRDAAVPGFIVGNKVDLADDETEAARGVAFATYKDFGYARTSAHTGMGIDDLFRQIAAELAKRPNMEEDVPVIGARPTNESGRMCICE